MNGRDGSLSMIAEVDSLIPPVYLNHNDDFDGDRNNDGHSGDEDDDDKDDDDKF
jgi:hypothetical protein